MLYAATTTTYRSGSRYCIGSLVSSSTTNSVSLSSLSLSFSNKAILTLQNGFIANSGKNWTSTLQSKNSKRWSSTEGSSASTSTSTSHVGKTFGSHKQMNDGYSELIARIRHRTPVSWTQLIIVAVASSIFMFRFKIERERILEEAVGKIVTSESDGWSPDNSMFSKRKFVKTKEGWFPANDGCDAGRPAVGGPWTAVDLKGNFVTNRTFEGKWVLLYFGFARCPDICPSEMQKIGKVMDILKKDYPDIAKDVVPLFVSIDPARDSLKALQAYANDFHPSFVCVTGTPTQISDMAKKYRVYFSKADETTDGDYLVDHSIIIYCHHPDGKVSDCFSQSMRPTDIVKRLLELYNAKSEAD